MKTESVDMSRSELQYLMELVQDSISSEVYYGDQKQFYRMQHRVLDKLSEAIILIDPDMQGFTGDY